MIVVVAGMFLVAPSPQLSPAWSPGATFVHAALRSEVKPVERVRMHLFSEFFDNMPPQLKKELEQTAKKVVNNALEQGGMDPNAKVSTLYEDSDGHVSASESTVQDEFYRRIESFVGKEHDPSSSRHRKGANSKGQTSSTTWTTRSSDGTFNFASTESSYRREWSKVRSHTSMHARQCAAHCYAEAELDPTHVFFLMLRHEAKSSAL